MSPRSDKVDSIAAGVDCVQSNDEAVRSRILIKEPHQQESIRQKQPPLQIVWRNVALMLYLHVAALYGCYLAFTTAKAATNIWGIWSC